MHFACTDYLYNCLANSYSLGMYYRSVDRTVLCSIAVAVSLGAAVLLPTSIISNEIRHILPDAYYVNWLNTSLITGI